jgi:hypothetical protein
LHKVIWRCDVRILHLVWYGIDIGAVKP